MFFLVDQYRRVNMIQNVNKNIRSPILEEIFKFLQDRFYPEQNNRKNIYLTDKIARKA